MKASVHLFPDWLSETDCGKLMRRWNRAHAETGYVPDNAPPDTKDIIDHREKKRFDHFIRDDRYDSWLCRHLRDTLRPLGFSGGSIEYFRIGCYERTGHFALHRDNNDGRVWSAVCPLNQDFIGGYLSFPDLGVQLKPRPGTAVIFSAELLHVLLPVTRGRRFALITFASSRGRV